MYMTAIKELQDQVKIKIEESINSKLKTEILGITVQEAGFNGIWIINVMFKNNHGTADALVQCDGGNFKLLAPFKVKFNKVEEKK